MDYFGRQNVVATLNPILSESEGFINGTRVQGRPRRMWIDDIKSGQISKNMDN